MKTLMLPCMVFVVLSLSPAFGQEPASVVRWEKGSRYPQAGWIVLHIEGNPYERGVQHGRLMAPEIAGYLRCFARTLERQGPERKLAAPCALWSMRCFCASSTKNSWRK